MASHYGGGMGGLRFPRVSGVTPKLPRVGESTGKRLTGADEATPNKWRIEMDNEYECEDCGNDCDACALCAEQTQAEVAEQHPGA